MRLHAAVRGSGYAPRRRGGLNGSGFSSFGGAGWGGTPPGAGLGRGAR